MSSTDPNPGRPDPQVVGLAREVERAIRRLTELEALLRQLGEDVAVLTDAVAADDESPPLRSWLTADDPEQARADLADLVEWLARIYLRYPDAVLPSCWAWHPAVVEELWWLRQAHRVAYGGRGASWREVGDWHDRQRPGVVRRARAVANGCELALHTPDADRPEEPAGVPLAAHLDQIAEHWATHGTGPEPTAGQLAEAERHDHSQHRKGSTR